MNIKSLLAIVSLFTFQISTAQKNIDQDIVTPISPSEVRTYNRQKDNKDFFTRVSNFSELSWVSPPTFDIGHHKGIYLLSADISPHFMIGGERMPIVLQLTPRYKVRIFKDNLKFNDISLPVRTPSFMPGATVSFRTKRSDFDVYKDINYWSVSIFHHSNGQDGDTYSSPEVFNYYNGNFSTNYIELAHTINIRTPGDVNDVKFECEPQPGDCNRCPPDFNRGYTDCLLRLGIEQHIGTAYAQRGTYGRTRLNIRPSFIKVKTWRWRVRDKGDSLWRQVGSCYQKESFRIVVNCTANLDKLEKPYGSLSRRFNIDASIHSRIAASNTALFATIGYYGNDPYNIYYSKNYFFVRAGLSLGFFVHTSKLQN